MNSKTSFKINLSLSDSQISKLKDAGDVSSIKVKIAATHSGIVNKNNWFYTPAGMKKGTSTFTTPFNKPVLSHHGRHEDSIGRVLESEYVDNEDVDVSFKDSKSPIDIVDEVIDFVNSKEYKAKSFKGLGQIDLVAEITDEDAIQKVIDQRYLTVSISGNVDSAVCSSCGIDIKAQQSDNSIPFEDRCHHYPGEIVDGEKTFMIGGNMEFDEVSYVNSPADSNAISEIIRDSVSDDIILSNQAFEILDFVVKDKNAGDNKLKIKLEDLFKNKEASVSALKDMGLESLVLTDERYSKLRKTSFLFADEKSLPVNDKAHILAAFKVLETIEDSEQKTQALEVLNKKFVNQFGDDKEVSTETTLFIDKNTKEANSDSKSESASDTATVTIDEDKLAGIVATKVLDLLKESINVSDSYMALRNDALETEVDTLEKELNSISDKYKSSLVNQILTHDDKLKDSDYASKLNTRSVESLHDKLEDLGLIEDSSKGDNQDDKDADSKTIDGNESVSVSDAAASEGHKDETSDSNDDSKDDNVMTIKEVRDQYSTTIKTEGMFAASKFIQKLADENKLPSNFTFQ